MHERLHDDHKRVQLAAAMCLYTLNQCTDEVMEILQYNLEHGTPGLQSIAVLKSIKVAELLL